jgi:hypothetical protein
MKTPGPIPGVLRYACEFNAMSKFKDATPIFSPNFFPSIFHVNLSSSALGFWKQYDVTQSFTHRSIDEAMR